MVTAPAVTAARSALYDGRSTPRVGGPNRHFGHRVLVFHALDVVNRLVGLWHFVVVVEQECCRKQYALRAGNP